MPGPTPRARGFTLIELLVVIAIIALLVSILLPVLASVKRTAKLSVCTNNMKQFSIATNNYATDFREILSGYTPPPLVNNAYVLKYYNGPTVPETIRSFTQPIAWMSNRGYDLIRRHSTPMNLTVAAVDNWLPQLFYSHLPLVAYMAKRLPEPVTACPEDTVRLRWQETPLTAVRGPDNALHDRWPYSSSYLYSIHATFPDRDTPMGASIRQSTTSQGVFTVSAVNALDFNVARRRISDVKHVSKKVSWFEEYDRHFRKPKDVPTYFMAGAAGRTLSTFFDGSARVVKGGEINFGAYTLVNNTPVNASVPYDFNDTWQGIPWFNGDNTHVVQGSPPPVVVPGPNQTRPGGMASTSGLRWTNGGLKGIDVTGAQ